VAAGQSRRMGKANKLLLPLDTIPVIARVIRAIQAGGIEHIVVVTGHDQQLVVDALQEYSVTLVHNPDYADGMAGSIRTGVIAAGPGQRYLICLGDMPLIQPATYKVVVMAGVDSSTIVQPTFDGQAGHPVVFGAAYYSDLCNLDGDQGARSIFKAAGASRQMLSVDDPGIVMDVDTPEHFATARAYIEATSW